MKLVVTEKPQELGTLLLGITTDPERDRFAQYCEVLRSSGIEVENKMKDTDTQSLPQVCSGEQCLSGRYPTISELCSWFDLDEALFADLNVTGSLFHAANDKRVGFCCGVGTDVYVDPNEDTE